MVVFSNSAAHIYSLAVYLVAIFTHDVTFVITWVQDLNVHVVALCMICVWSINGDMSIFSFHCANVCTLWERKVLGRD